MSNENNTTLTLENTGGKVSKRRSPVEIEADLAIAHRVMVAMESVARSLPKKLYLHRRSHRSAAFVASKSGKHRRTKHTKFALKLLTAQFRFGNLMEEYKDSQRNYTLKKSDAN